MSAGFVGPYQLQAELGQGGMATVYRAWDTVHQRTVALKVLPPTLSHNLVFVERFRREAQVAIQLSHPHIVPVYEANVAGGVAYLAMEYLPGGSLEDRLRQQRGPLDLALAVRIVHEVAQALDYAHGRRVVHRDVKTSNILFAADGRAVLTDFGVARILDATTITGTGMLPGTPLYMAPEQIQGHPVDHRADIYALGVVCYEMLAGRPPFVRENRMALLHAHVYETPPPLRRWNRRVPAAIEAAVHQALAKDPARRPGRASEFARALGTVPQPTSHPQPTSFPQTPTDIKAWLIVLGGMGVALVVLIALAGGLLAWGGSRPSPTSPARPTIAVTTMPADQASQLIAQGDSLVNRSQYAQGIAAYQQALALEPNNARAYVRWGRALYFQGNTAEAVSQCTQAANLDDQNAEAYAHLGRAYDWDGQYDEALRACQWAVTLDDRYAEGHAFLAEVYADLGQLDQALTQARRAVELDHNCAEAHTCLGFVLLKQGQKEAALSAYQEAVRLEPQLAVRYYDLGVVYSNLGQWDQARLSFMQTVALDTRHARGYNGLGVCYYQLHDYSQALTSLRQATELDPTYAPAYNHLGWCYVQLDRCTEAIPAFRQALSLNPALQEARDGLAACDATLP